MVSIWMTKLPQSNSAMTPQALFNSASVNSIIITFIPNFLPKTRNEWKCGLGIATLKLLHMLLPFRSILNYTLKIVTEKEKMTT